MTTDLDFRKLIDADPLNWHNVAVYGDYLQERGDSRALGFTALGNNRLVPYFFSYDKVWGFWDYDYYSTFYSNHPKKQELKQSSLPYCWVSLVKQQKHLKICQGRTIYHQDNRGSSAFVLYRAVALAFSKLPSKYQQEILNGNLDV